MLMNPLYSKLLATTNIYNSEKLTESILTNKKLNLTKEQAVTFKNVLSEEMAKLHTMETAQDMFFSNYLNLSPSGRSMYSNLYSPYSMLTRGAGTGTNISSLLGSMGMLTPYTMFNTNSMRLPSTMYNNAYQNYSLNYYSFI